jgi:hypothetical protein
MSCKDKQMDLSHRWWKSHLSLIAYWIGEYKNEFTSDEIKNLVTAIVPTTQERALEDSPFLF